MKLTSTFQEALETVEALSTDEQAMLVEIIQHRLRQQQRDELIQTVNQSEQDYMFNNVRRGTVADLMALDE